ncbi:Phage integrase SAM-like domain-containing protein [Porphyromonadaceae bacterium KH3CP3RA]|nr:Phage integrase SAM-like domain-containing protein [Porphyromonadaceae bacterium KH3CP3RA]
MNATINVVCYKSKTLSNGENPLMIRVSKNGKKTYKSLGLSVNPMYWDFEKDKPKRNCPDKKQIENLIIEKLYHHRAKGKAKGNNNVLGLMKT